jgi:nitrite reductase/ring-hydroxylating ferredoxin subunit/uncharacterized membrane protein
MNLSSLVGRLERAKGLDPAAKAVTDSVNRVLARGPVKDALHGGWLEHQLHPLLVAVPIGLWSGASLLDLTGGRSARSAAQRLVGAGVLAAVPTAASGLADWSELGYAQRPKRVGLVHAAANTVTLVLYAASWAARRRGDQARGTALALAGAGGLTVGGYLGGHLAYAQAVGVNRNADAPKKPADWTDVAAAADLAEGALLRVDAAGQPVDLARQGGTVTGLLASCSHYGGPLDEGEVVGSGPDACVVCPWHASHFRLVDGTAAHGPATVPQPSYDVREVGGRLEVRARQ